jgi:hypothetical protein
MWIIDLEFKKGKDKVPPKSFGLFDAVGHRPLIGVEITTTTILIEIQYY